MTKQKLLHQHHTAIPFIYISATAVREMCREGLSPRYLLPDVVIDYIRDQQLYM